jgi:hypothetical protein
MNEMMQDEECLATQTQGCCEGGRRPFSQRKEPKCEQEINQRLDSMMSKLKEPSQCCVMPVDLPEIMPMFTQEQVDEVKAIAKGTDALLAERAKDYGPPEINMTGIGLIWTAQLRNHWGMPDLPIIPGSIVGLMMAGVKLNRLAKSPNHKDSYDDLDGYAEIAKSLAK